jgi:hypothetical protein
MLLIVNVIFSVAAAAAVVIVTVIVVVVVGVVVNLSICYFLLAFTAAGKIFVYSAISPSMRRENH